MATSQTKRANLRAIGETVNWFSPGGDWRGLHAIAARESALNHYAAARSPLDRQGARRAWDKRMKAKLAEHGNPYLGPEYQHEEQGGWFNSHGLFQLMAPYHVPKWSWTAPPSILLNPVISTVIAARLWNRGRRAGAKNLCELRSFWKYGRMGADPDPESRCRNTMDRLRRLGYSPSLALQPLSSFGLDGFGTDPQPDDAEKAADVLDVLGLPPDGSIGPEWTPNDPDIPGPSDPPEAVDPIDPIDPGHPVQPPSGSPSAPNALLVAALAYLALRS